MDVLLPLGLVVAGALALAVLATLGRAFYRDHEQLPEGLSAVTIASAVAIGAVVSFGVRTWPTDITYRVPHVALLAGVASLLLYQLTGRLRVLGWAAVVGIAGLISWMLLAPRAAQTDSGGVKLLLGGAGLALLSAVSVRAGVRSSSTGAWLAAVLNGVVIAAACALSGTVTVGVLGGMVTAALVGASLARFLIRPGVALGPALVVASLTQVALLGLAFGYGEMRPTVLGLCGTQIVLFGLLGAHRRADMLRVVAVLFVGGLSLWQATLPETTGATPATDVPTAADGADYDYGYGY